MKFVQSPDGILDHDLEQDVLSTALTTNLRSRPRYELELELMEPPGELWDTFSIDYHGDRQIMFSAKLDRLEKTESGTWICHFSEID